VATVNDLIQELNDHGFTDTGTPRKVALINDTIWDISERALWPFLEQTVTHSFTGSSAVSEDEPTDRRVTLSLVDVSTGRPLVPFRLDDFEKKFGSRVTETGEPLVYFYVGTELNVWPVPPSSAELRERYVRVPAAVNDASVEADIIIPKQHHRAITLGVLLKLYDMEDDPELAMRFEQHYEARIERMKNSLQLLQVDRPQVVHVLDDDDDDWF
jgi:hypothetical protein